MLTEEQKARIERMAAWALGSLYSAAIHEREGRAKAAARNLRDARNASAEAFRIATQEPRS